MKFIGNTVMLLLLAANLYLGFSGYSKLSFINLLVAGYIIGVMLTVFLMKRGNNEDED